MASTIAAQHHENWDGNGHPKGLKGEEIDLSARIVTVVDIIDALGCKKSYRNAFSDDEIRSFVTEHSGKIFDPKLATHALELLPQFQQIRAEHPDSHWSVYFAK